MALEPVLCRPTWIVSIIIPRLHAIGGEVLVATHVSRCRDTRHGVLDLGRFVTPVSVD